MISKENWSSPSVFVACETRIGFASDWTSCPFNSVCVVILYVENYSRLSYCVFALTRE